MAKALWNGSVLAESDETIMVEGSLYFPVNALKREYFQPGTLRTTCPTKGLANYYSVEVNGKTNPNAAFYYPSPKDAAKHIAGYIAFWKGVEVED